MINCKVSVILTSYNHEKYIKQTIDSILNQTYDKYELIIIDDCSTDDSWKIISSYKDSRITAYRNSNNTCADDIIFDAIKRYATGKYCAICHSDDKWHKDKLQKQVDFLDDNPDIAACFTLATLIDENDSTVVTKCAYSKVFDKDNRSRHEWLNYFFYSYNCLCHPSVMIRKNVYKQCGLNVAGLSSLPDFCQWIRLCRKKNIWIIQEKLTHFRIRDNGSNTSGDTFEKSNQLYFEHYIILDEFLKIKHYREFVKIFPQAQKFNVDNHFIVEFAYAQILLESRCNHVYHLYGLNLLNKLITNKKKAAKIKKLYNYDISDYIKDKSKYDIFSVVPKNRLLCSSIYPDLGNGFSEETRIINNKVYLDNCGRFFVEFSLSHINEFTKIRFDPNENSYNKFSIDNIIIDGNKVDFMAQNASVNKDGWDYFFTNDPIYAINTDINKCNRIIIEGRAKELSSNETYENCINMSIQQ